MDRKTYSRHYQQGIRQRKRERLEAERDKLAQELRQVEDYKKRWNNEPKFYATENGSIFPNKYALYPPYTEKEDTGEGRRNLPIAIK